MAAVVLLIAPQQHLAAQGPVLDPSLDRAEMSLMHDIHLGFQVYWHPPYASGVTDYDLQYREYDDDNSEWGDWTDWSHTGTATFTLLTGLTEGSNYQTRVRYWIGADRYSRWSLWENDVAITARSRNYQDRGYPDPPVLPTATISPGVFTVHWIDPGTANNAVDITGYRVQWYTPTDSWRSPMLPATATSYDIPGMTADTRYHVAVTAHSTPHDWTHSPALAATSLGTPPLPDPPDDDPPDDDPPDDDPPDDDDQNDDEVIGDPPDPPDDPNDDDPNDDDPNDDDPNDDITSDPTVPNMDDITIDIGDVFADVLGNAALRELEISSGNLHFDSDTFAYQVDVPQSTFLVTVTATPRSFLARITVDGQSATRSRPSHDIILSEDPTFISVIVRAHDGTSTTAYTITVHRADS